MDAAGGAMPEEFLIADLVRAGQALDELTGARAPDDVLAEIFEVLHRQVTMTFIRYNI